MSDSNKDVIKEFFTGKRVVIDMIGMDNRMALMYVKGLLESMKKLGVEYNYYGNNPTMIKGAKGNRGFIHVVIKEHDTYGFRYDYCPYIVSLAVKSRMIKDKDV